MEFFLVPNNPEHTVLVSPNGVAHYQVTTSKSKIFGAPGVSRIQRPAETEEDSIVAEIEWKTWGTRTLVRSALLNPLSSTTTFSASSSSSSTSSLSASDGCLAAQEFLYKRNPFSSSRYFLGNDDQEYRWKPIKGKGGDDLVLTHSDTHQEVARIIHCLTGDGLFEGERKCCLRVQPCSVDIDLVVLSCMILEKKRRDRAGDGTRLSAHDEDPQGDGGGAEGGGA